jgi:hypothetical protein
MSARKDVAYHEAGHAVIALDEGIGLGATVDMSLREGICHFADARHSAEKDPPVWARKFIKALLAGQISQERFVAEQGFAIQDDEREAWGEDNRSCQVIAQNALKLDEDRANAEINGLREEVVQRFRDPKLWSAVKIVATELNLSGSLPGVKAKKIFDGCTK